MNETAKRAPVERIVGRLRQYVILRTEADNDSRRHDLMLDAADEIERLQAENGALRNRLVSEIRKSEPGGFECATAEAEAKVNEYLDRFRAAMDQRKKPPNAEVRGASRLAGEASSAEGATSTVVLGADRPGKD